MDRGHNACPITKKQPIFLFTNTSNAIIFYRRPSSKNVLTTMPPAYGEEERDSKWISSFEWKQLLPICSSMTTRISEGQWQLNICNLPQEKHTNTEVFQSLGSDTILFLDRYNSVSLERCCSGQRLPWSLLLDKSSTETGLWENTAWQATCDGPEHRLVRQFWAKTSDVRRGSWRSDGEMWEILLLDALMDDSLQKAMTKTKVNRKKSTSKYSTIAVNRHVQTYQHTRWRRQ